MLFRSGTCVPALTFQFLNIDQLRAKLQNSQDYAGLILTSQNAVEACLKANNLLGEDILRHWHDKHNYTVGEATYRKGLWSSHPSYLSH